jgi:hypothetical protein
MPLIMKNQKMIIDQSIRTITHQKVELRRNQTKGRSNFEFGELIAEDI